jgi:hypothetical protein
MFKIRDKKRALKNISIYLIIIFGFFLFLEPNMRGSSGVHEMNTLGKLIGWIMIWGGFSLLVRAHPWLMPFRDLIVEHIPLWKLFSYVFFGTAMLSGTMGFIARKSFGIAHIDYIDSMFMWLLEGIYAMLGIAGVLFTWIEPARVFNLFRKAGWKEPDVENKRYSTEYELQTEDLTEENDD